MSSLGKIAVLGAGLAGCTASLELARRGHEVTLIDRLPRPMLGASRHNEGKLHLGYVYGADPSGRTHPVLASGSLRFIDMIEQVTGVPGKLLKRSDPFNYIVPEDSIRPVDEIREHVRRVDQIANKLCAEYDYPEIEPSSMIERSSLAKHYSERVQAGFKTSEIAIDPFHVADLVTAAVYAHPNIRFIAGCNLSEAENLGSRGYRIKSGDDSSDICLEADGVINSLWEERVRMDQSIGLATNHRWSQRWKATITIEVEAGSINVPSTTAIVGPFGDFVLYGGKRIYISWYPACRLSMTTGTSPDDVRTRIAKFDMEEIRLGALQGLATLIPDVVALTDRGEATRVGGGFILAVGETDIDTATSGLHQRHQIGVEAHGNWISVSTGKFCTAPMFGIEAAENLSGRLS